MDDVEVIMDEVDRLLEGLEFDSSSIMFDRVNYALTLETHEQK